MKGVNKWAELLTDIVKLEDKQKELCKDPANRVNCVECELQNIVLNCEHRLSTQTARENNE